MKISQGILTLAHMVIGAGLIVTATVLSATGHTSGLLDAMFGAGAAMFPVAAFSLPGQGTQAPPPQPPTA